MADDPIVELIETVVRHRLLEPNTCLQPDICNLPPCACVSNVAQDILAALAERGLKVLNLKLDEHQLQAVHDTDDLLWERADGSKWIRWEDLQRAIDAAFDPSQLEVEHPLPRSESYPIGTIMTVANYDSETPLVVQGVFRVPLGRICTVAMTQDGWEMIEASDLPQPEASDDG